MSILVIDYGMGNLRSVSKAIDHFGGKARISSNAEDLAKADKVVLPGVGAFGNAMQELNQRGLVDGILAHVKKEKPFLGICLGLQILFESSEESPGIQGLGIFPGRVNAFNNRNEKVPHMGWNSIRLQGAHPILDQVQDGSYFYFVHSYYANSEDRSLTLGACEYGAQSFSAIVGAGNVIATQFHPEKSQEAGLQILKNFIGW